MPTVWTIPAVSGWNVLGKTTVSVSWIRTLPWHPQPGK